ncbi:MAG TPA: hypothetical protein VME66_01865 [Candidatus Acidoferrales bacterium]|nr:hypothetical protein [Candidatus Acidoferrales bacterium]
MSGVLNRVDYSGAALFGIPEDYRALFDRVSFGFDHNLGDLDLLHFDTLCELAQTYDRDYFVAGGAPVPAAQFYSVRHGVHTPYEALQRLEYEDQRVTLKSPEQYDERYRALLHTLFEQIVRMHGGLRGARVVRLVSTILISSAATITPFHFDPETTFFFQIEGEKSYHLYRPTVLLEPELEDFYSKGIVNIGQVALEGRDPAQESVFHLAAGKGMHQPQNSPHWVKTEGTRSISYTISFETDVSRALGRTRAYNYYQRRLGLHPAAPGVHPRWDAAKARVMQGAIPVRKGIGQLVRNLPSLRRAASDSTQRSST